MADLFDDGDVRLSIRNKINTIAGCLKIAETDEAITAGAATSIPIAALRKSILPSGNTVILVDADTGGAHTLTLTDDAEASDEVLTVSSYSFASDVPSGSHIYVNIIDILNELFFSA